MTLLQVRENAPRLTLACVLLIGCAQIAGIEKRSSEVEDAGEGSNDGGADEAGDAALEIVYATAEECEDYCARATTVCPENTGISAFARNTYCQDVCLHFQHSADPEQAEGNTFECKQKELSLAERLTRDEIESNCKALGTGGGDKCGSDCEGYCQQYASVCSELAVPDCLEHCPKLRSDPSLDSQGSFGSKHDTLQCRLAHLSAAAVDPVPHCMHAALVLQAGPMQPCNPDVPNCEDYCGMLMNTCKDAAFRQYDNITDCLNTCRKGFEPGKGYDENGDTLACRRYHTYNSMFDPKGHCAHTGPGGDGHCGRVCPAYCKLAQAACQAEFMQVFPGGRTECESSCATLTGKAEANQENFGYNVDLGKAGNNDIQCRLYYTSKAFTNESACPSALGRGECQ